MHLLRRRQCFAYVIERLSPLLESIGCFGFAENLSTLSSLPQAHDPLSGGLSGQVGGRQPSPHGPAWQRGRRDRGERVGFALLRSFDTQNKPIFRIQTPWGVGRFATPHAEQRNSSPESDSVIFFCPVSSDFEFRVLLINGDLASIATEFQYLKSNGAEMLFKVRPSVRW